MADWYYASNKQRLGPVSLDKLRQLADAGLLKPADLVWNDDMRDWARADTQGLFGQGGIPIAAMLDDGAEAGRTKPSRRTDDYDDEDEDRPRRRRRLPMGVKVGLLVGCGVLLLLIGGLALYLFTRPGAGMNVAGMGDFPGFLGPADPRDAIMNAPSQVYNVFLQQGRTYIFDMRSTQFNSFLRLEDSGMRQWAQDDDSGGGWNARIIFRCPRDGNYRVIATNVDQGQGAYTLSIREN